MRRSLYDLFPESVKQNFILGAGLSSDRHNLDSRLPAISQALSQQLGKAMEALWRSGTPAF
jgi:hypothetical protein